MFKDNSEDILSTNVESINISLFSSKTSVLIIGGGRAGFIKSRSFAKSGCQVLVVSKSFCEDFQQLKKLSNVKLVESEYKTEFILKMHLIVIAVNDMDLLQSIVKDCDTHCKLYLNCKDFKKGFFVLPVSGKTENINFSVNTLGGNPKTAIFLAKVMREKLREYDKLVSFNCSLRDKLKNSPNKDEIMDFLASEDFNFFINKGVSNIVLKLFYGGKNFEIKNSNQEK